jgi:trk system potassium uptake protein TrkH
MNYRMIAYSMGRIMAAIGATMLIPMFLSIYYHEGISIAYLIPIAISVVLGAAVSFKIPKNKNLFAKEGMVIVATSWILISIFGALPFFISGEIPNFVDCFFETVSGFTTTGSTILTNVESMSKSLLFWRSFTHWLGGMGVLVFAMAIFSSKDTRATHMMRAEMPGPVVGKLASRWQFSLRILYVIYISLTVLEIVLLLFGGMPLFDSIVHTFGTAGTGGFGIKNTSIGYYDSAYIDYVIGIFMMLFGLNFNVYYLILARKIAQLKNNDEVKWYIGLMLGSAVIIALNIMPMYHTFANSFRYSFFQVSSIMTTTGYATADFVTWPMLSQIILVMLMIVGACAGSTGGGIKVIRVVILGKRAVHAIKKAVSPRSVMSVKADGKRIETAVVHGVLAYFVIYMFFMGISILIVSLDNKDFATTVTSVIATMNNIGPGLGTVGPTGNFADFSALSKIVMSVGMLVGRLEFYPILILLSPRTWKKI